MGQSRIAPAITEIKNLESRDKICAFYSKISKTSTTSFAAIPAGKRSGMFLIKALPAVNANAAHFPARDWRSPKLGV